MNLVKCCFLIFVTLLCVSCVDVKSSQYKDTSELEQPPQMEIVVKKKAEVTSEEEQNDQGLGSRVTFSESTGKSAIKIKKLFNRSWNIVEQALKLNDIEIKDKNRELGVFYILFDPDELSDREESVLPNFAFSFFQDDYDKAAYKLLVIWKESVTEVTADLVEDDVSDLLDDDEDELGNDADGGKILLKTLYKTIKEDLPIN